MSGEPTTAHDPLQKLAVIIGATRSGSTSLVEALSQHPEICACRVEEAGFFSNDDRWERGVASYRDMWDWNPEQHKVALEKTTNYSKVTIFPMAASRMAEVAPNAKIMYIMRHPFERIESQYTLGRATGWRESKRSLRQGVHQDLIECSRYAKQLDAYFWLFPRENMLLLRFEELRDSPAVLLDRVCGFLAIDRSYEFQGLDRAHNSNAGRRPGEIGQILYRMRGRVPFWQKIVSRMSPEQKNRVRQFFASKGGSNAALSEQQKLFVLAELRDDIERLKSAYGFDTEPWGLEFTRDDTQHPEKEGGHGAERDMRAAGGAVPRGTRPCGS